LILNADPSKAEEKVAPFGALQVAPFKHYIQSLKQKIKTITRKTTPCSFGERIERLKELQRGWLGYFRLASIHGKLKDLDGWIRNRLRYCIWQKTFLSIIFYQRHTFWYTIQRLLSSQVDHVCCRVHSLLFAKGIPNIQHVNYKREVIKIR